MNDKPGSDTTPEPGADIGAEDVELAKPSMEEDEDPPKDDAASGTTSHESSQAAASPARASLRAALVTVRDWWAEQVIDQIDQAEVIERRREDCALSERYLFITAMSAGIAVLGLLLGSPAVVIGAMLLSPLMDPTGTGSSSRGAGCWSAAFWQFCCVRRWCFRRRSIPSPARLRREPGRTCSTCSWRCFPRLPVPMH